MADRDYHRKYYPSCPTNVALVDQYMWSVKDSNQYGCTNGVSAPIYEIDGTIAHQLPLELYPPVNDIHPEVKAQLLQQRLQRRNVYPFFQTGGLYSGEIRR